MMHGKHLILNIHLVTKPCPTLATPGTVACQTPLSMEFSKQEYWSGLPFPSPGDLPDPGIEPTSPVWAGRFFTAEPRGMAANGQPLLAAGSLVMAQ